MHLAATANDIEAEKTRNRYLKIDLQIIFSDQKLPIIEIFWYLCVPAPTSYTEFYICLLLGISDQDSKTIKLKLE